MDWDRQPVIAIEDKVLDHGFVRLIESYGSDQRIIEAARMSTDKGFLGWDLPCGKCNGTGAALVSHFVDGDSPCTKCKGSGKYGDEMLLKYLYEHKHHTPFEMAGMIIEVQAPILAFRQWERHRTQSYNELSARYTELPDVFYIPSLERIRESAQSSSNKQASGKGELTCSAEDVQYSIQVNGREAYERYQWMIKHGVAPELARCALPVNIYSRMRANANLRNWLGFLTLRMDPHAQWETRQFANVVGVMIEKLYPRTWKLFLAHKTW